MTYEELLKDDRWKVKRKEIIVRDELTCQKCKNSSLDHEFRCSQAKRTYNSSLSVTYAILQTTPLQFIPFELKNYWETIQFEEDLVMYYAQCENRVYPIAFRKVEETEIVKKESLNLVPKPLPASTKNLEWLYNGTLHVHHTYYQQNRYPWEYPNEALITLCWKCHSLEHEDKKVPVISETGVLIDYYNLCKRCCGAGIFPEYKHVESGVCFRCRGAKYEELILGVEGTFSLTPLG